MSLEDISNIYQKSLNSFFRNKQIINLIYTEQFGKKYTDYEEELKKKYGEEYFKHDIYYKEYMHILDNTVFIPYITLKDLDRMLINERASFVSKYLEENPEENESLNEYLTEESEEIKQDTIKEYSSSLLNDLKELFPNLTEEQYSKTLKLCSNIEITALEHLIPDLTEDYEYSEILKHCSNIDSNENAKFIELDTLKQLLPTLTKKQYSTILKHCSNIAAQSITDEFFSGKKSLFPKSKKSKKLKKLKAEKIIEKNIEDKDTKIYNKTLYLRIAAEKEYGSEYMESNFSKELDLSKRLNAKKRDIIKKYSSFMLDDLKEFFPGLTKDEYSKILNITFYKKTKSIEDELFKDKIGFFTKSQKSKVEKIIKKYKKLADEKVLMETSSFYKHLSDVPKGKYYTDILEGISSGGQFVTQKIGKKTEKNIRYIFLPVFKYKTKEEYLKNALHEVMHISKEHLSNKHYQSGFVVRNLSKNPLDPTLGDDISNLRDWGQKKWSKIIAKKHNLPSPNPSYNITDGTMSAEEVIHHFQSREALDQIANNDDLMELLDFPYINKSIDNPPTKLYELFDDTTKKFIKRFKTDIQNVNNGNLSVKNFKRKVGISNFALFAQTAHLCTKDNNVDNIIVSNSSLIFANLISNSNEFPDNHKYNRIGKDVVEKMKKNATKVEKRQAFLEKTKKAIGSMNILNIGKSIESEVKNRAKNISNEPTR